MTERNQKKGTTPVPARGAAKGRRRPPGRRAEAEARRRRRRNWWAALAVVVVVAIIAVVVVLGVQSTNAKAAARAPIPADLATALTSVAVGDLAAGDARVSQSNLVGAQPLRGAPLLAPDGKPEILFIGAEFCPICATERWAMTVALSQFGTFGNLHQTRSAVRDGDIATISFFGSTYSSKYFDFVPVEATTNVPKGSSYQPLQPPTSEQETLWATTMAQFGQRPSYPFLDIGGKYLIYTAQYSAQDLSGLNFDQIAGSVGNNDNTVGADIDAAAAQLVHYICGITGQQPAAACQAVANIPLAAAPASQASTSPAGG